MSNVGRLTHFKTQGSIYRMEEPRGEKPYHHYCEECAGGIRTSKARLCRGCACKKAALARIRLKLAATLCKNPHCTSPRYLTSPHCKEHSHLCVDCGAIVAWNQANRCKSCKNIHYQKKRTLAKLTSANRIMELKQIIEAYSTHGDTSCRARVPELQKQLALEEAIAA